MIKKVNGNTAGVTTFDGEKWPNTLETFEETKALNSNSELKSGPKLKNIVYDEKEYPTKTNTFDVRQLDMNGESRRVTPANVSISTYLPEPPSCNHYVDVKIVNGIIISYCTKCGNILNQERVNY